MKHYFILTAVSLAFVLPGYTQPGNAPFANRYLSNLRSPTALNVNLLPWKNNEINLGSTSKNWKNFYLEGNVYKGSNRFLSSDNSGNTFLGISTGKFNTGLENTAVGDSVMYSNTTGTRNTATGYQALFNNVEGVWNDAYGYQALFNNNGTGNDAFGLYALHDNTTGYFNTASGFLALQHNTEGFYNVASGPFALGLNTTGSGNTGIGQSALWTNETNSNNTALGNEATGNSFDYSNATFLGAFTNSDAGVTNVTAIGFGAHAKKSNQVIVGNTEVTSIGGYANWSNFSDGRYKKNIKEDVPGLEFITQLRPVTYTLDLDGIEGTKQTGLQKPNAFSLPDLNKNKNFSDNAFEKAKQLQLSKDLKAKQEKAKVVYTGFIAQEVEQAAKKLNYDFSGVDAPKSAKGFYALRYGDFIVPLVKAVQEQQKQIEKQQKQIEELKTLIQSLTTENISTSNFSSTASLKQNAPNPFSKNTVISYYIPGNVGHAQILVTDMKGSLIRTFTVTKGEGQINISSGELPAATYNYTLLVNGKRIDTKRMVIGK